MIVMHHIYIISRISFLATKMLIINLLCLKSCYATYEMWESEWRSWIECKKRCLVTIYDSEDFSQQEVRANQLNLNTVDCVYLVVRHEIIKRSISRKRMSFGNIYSKKTTPKCFYIPANKVLFENQNRPSWRLSYFSLIRDALTGNLPADIVTYLGERGNGQYLWNYFVQHPDEVKYGVVNTIDYMTAAMAQWSNTDQVGCSISCKWHKPMSSNCDGVLHQRLKIERNLGAMMRPRDTEE